MSQCTHSHDDHEHNPDQLTTAFKISIILNLVFVCIEIFFGYSSNSMSLIADAFHNLSDVFSLLVALIGFYFSQKNNGQKISAGISVFNSAILILTLFFLIYKSFIRLFSNDFIAEIDSNTVMIIAFIGIFINFFSAKLFKIHQHHDLNAEGAYLHLMADAAISLGVVISAIIIKYSGFSKLDSIVSILISLIILKSTSQLLIKSVKEYRLCNLS